MTITIIQGNESVININTDQTKKINNFSEDSNSKIDTQDQISLSNKTKCTTRQIVQHLIKTGSGALAGGVASLLVTRDIPVLVKPFTSAGAGIWGVLAFSGISGAIVGNFSDNKTVVAGVGAGVGALTGAIVGVKVGGVIPALTGVGIGAISGTVSALTSSNVFSKTKIKL